MDVKKSLQNITAWAKKNPWLAGGIVLFLLILGVWASRRGAGGALSIGASQSESLPMEEPELGSLTPTGGGSLFDSFKEPVAGIPQPAPVYDAPIFDNMASIPAMQDMGLFDPGSVQDMVYSAPSTSGVGEALKDIAAPSSSGSFFMGALSYDTKEEIPSKIVSADPTPQPKAKVAAPSGKSPAYYKGKGNKFTGYIDGVYYVNGYPAASTSVAAQTNIKPSAGSQVAPSSGGGFFVGQYLDPTVTKPKGSLVSQRGGSI